MPKVILQRLSPLATIPTRATTGAAGYDIHACFDSARPPVRSIGHDRVERLKESVKTYSEELARYERNMIASNITQVQWSNYVSPPIFPDIGTHSSPYESTEYRNPGSPLWLDPGRRVLIPTGIALRIPAGWEIQLRSRSGLAYNKGLTVLNSPATIDEDYRGEIFVLLANLGTESIAIAHDDRIAQMLILPTFEINFAEGEVNDQETGRGSAGFGSTG